MKTIKFTNLHNSRVKTITLPGNFRISRCLEEAKINNKENFDFCQIFDQYQAVTDKIKVNDINF